MSDLNAAIVPKQSNTESAVPTAGQLEVGEIAVNTADGKIFTKHTDDSIKEISGSGGGGSGLPSSGQPGDLLTLDSGVWAQMDINAVLAGSPGLTVEMLLDFEGNDVPALNSLGMTTAYPSTDAKWGNGAAEFVRANADFLQGSWTNGPLGTDPWTFTFWAKTSDANYSVITGRRLIAPVSGTNLATGFQVMRESAGGDQYTPHADNAQGAYVLNGSSAADGYMASTRTINTADGQWHWVVFSHEGDGVYTCYWDGQLTERRNRSVVNLGENGGFFLGKRQDNSANAYFDGVIDNIMLTKSALYTGLDVIPYPSGPTVITSRPEAVLGSIGDVSTTTASNGQGLVWSDGEWGPATVVNSVNGESGAIDLPLGGLSDTDIPTSGGFYTGMEVGDPLFDETNAAGTLSYDGTVFKDGARSFKIDNPGGMGSCGAVLTDVLSDLGVRYDCYSLWFRSDVEITTSNRTILVANQNRDLFGAGSGFALYTRDSAFGFYTDGEYISIGTRPTLAANTWHHAYIQLDWGVGVNREVAPEGVSIWINGSLAANNVDVSARQYEAPTAQEQVDWGSPSYAFANSTPGAIHWRDRMMARSSETPIVGMTTQSIVPEDVEALLYSQGPATGDVLEYNGTVWAPAAASTASDIRALLGISEYASDADAGTGGVASGALYYNTGSSDYRLKS